MTFDAPDSLLACSRRERSTTPLQALNLLNDPVFFEAAQGLAARVLREAPGNLSSRIDYAFQTLSGARSNSGRERATRKVLPAAERDAGYEPRKRPSSRPGASRESNRRGGGLDTCSQRIAEPGRIHHKRLIMDLRDFVRIQSRRSFFSECAGGVGAIALWNLLAREGRAEQNLPATNPLAPKASHFAPKAKNVIFMFMDGAPSHIDLFDPKPEMKKWDGQPLPASMTKNLKLAFIKPTAKVWASPRIFTPSGKSGIEFSDWMPHIATLRRRHLHDPLDVHRSVQSSPRPADAELRKLLLWAGPRWAPGSRTGWAANHKTCRASWCSAPGEAPAQGMRTGQAGFFLPAIRV